MTIMQPQISVADKILMVLGKKRGIRTISGLYYTWGPYAYAKLEKESFRVAPFCVPKAWICPKA